MKKKIIFKKNKIKKKIKVNKKVKLKIKVKKKIKPKIKTEVLFGVKNKKKSTLKKKIKSKVILKRKKIIKKIKNKKVFNKKVIKKDKKVLNKKKVISKKIKKVKKIIKKGEIKEIYHPKLSRSINNPIIEPSFYSWESKATFNPTAFIDGDKIHIIYRAVGEDEVSVLGYANSFDGYNINERPSYFIYKRFNLNFKESDKKLNYSSGDGWNGGAEDPRVVLIENRIYLLYTAFDGWSSVRMALTSISLDDFKKRKWNWTKPVLISPPGEINKNWVLFPEKINGKFAIMHSFYPSILIDYFDDLNELDGNNFIKSNNTRPVDKSRGWDSWFRGVGPAPMKIKEGWLILYHAMDHKNPDRYRMGALILDYKNPTKILYRSKKPILEPEEHYENHGHKFGVVYSCGAVIKDDRLFVYYGGSDKVTCVASIMLNELVYHLKKNKVIKLKENKIKK